MPPLRLVPNPKPLQIIREDGFIDLELGIMDAVEHEGWTTVEAAAHHEGRTVGVSVAVLRSGAPRQVTEWLTVIPAVVVLSSQGEESDELLRVLSKLFEGDDHPATMVDQLELASVSLAGDPARVLEQPVKLKVFHDLGLAKNRPAPMEHEDESVSYFDWYINIDRAAGVVQFRETDPEYREAIVGVLGGRFATPFVSRLGDQSSSSS